MSEMLENVSVLWIHMHYPNNALLLVLSFVALCLLSILNKIRFSVKELVDEI